MSIAVNVGGVWKDTTPYVKVGGVWKPVTQAYVKVSGGWKELLGGAAPATVTYVTTIDDGNGATTYTFTNANIGAAATDRLVVGALSWEATANRSLVSATIGGNAASVIVNGGGVETSAAIFALRVAAGATATIVATLSGAALRAAIGIWNVNGQISDTPTAFGQSASNSSVTSHQTDINVLSGGVAIAALGLNAPNAVTWTGATERYDATYDANSRKSGADYSNAGADEPHSIIAAFSATNGGLAAASWR